MTEFDKYDKYDKCGELSEFSESSAAGALISSALRSVVRMPNALQNIPIPPN